MNKPSERVQITYDVQVGDVVEQVELPFVLGILSPLSGSNNHADDPGGYELKDRTFYDLDRDTFESVMKQIRPMFRVKVPAGTCGFVAADIVVELTFGSMADFEPASLLKNIPGLATLLQQAPASPFGEVPSNSTLDSTPSTSEKLDGRMATILNWLLHQPDFQRLEASWRSLQNLSKTTNTSQRLKLRVLDVTRDELRDDLTKLSNSDQSVLWKKVYEERYGTFGGEPFSCLLGDYAFSPSTTDVATLQSIANVAAAVHTPFLTSADSKMFDLDTFTDLGKPRDLEKVFADSDHIGWLRFRDSEDSRYVALTLPRVLVREPYCAIDVGDFTFTEDATSAQSDKLLWGNSAFALAQRITSAYDRYGWCATIHGVRGGELVTDPPSFSWPASSANPALQGQAQMFQSPTEVLIAEEREIKLSKLGFIALCYREQDATAAFLNSQTANRPTLYLDDAANANSTASSSLPYMLVSSRFAHYIKVMMRENIGLFQSCDSVNEFLNAWISGYVLLTDVAPQSTMAQFPLREARVDVTDTPGEPGSYTAVIYLRPHYLLQELSASVRLVAHLPPPVAA